jgi:carboxypeptidase Q
MVSPRPITLTAIPIAWTPATAGKISAPVVVAPMSEERHFERYRGKLAGKIVLVTLPNDGSEPTDPAPFKRWTGDELTKLDTYEQPKYDPEASDAG